MIENNIKSEIVNFLTDLTKRAIAPEINLVFEHLDFIYHNEWHHLTTKESIETWLNPLIDFEFIEYSKGLEEVIIHSNSVVHYIVDGKDIIKSLTYSQSEIDLSFEIQCIKNQVDWNESNPFVSFKLNFLEKYIRLSLTHRSLSPTHSHKASLRFHNDTNYPLEDYFINKAHLEKVITLFKDKNNILVCGSTGSGKTSFMSSLLSYCNENEHVFIIEDTLELNSPNLNTTRLVSKEKEGYGLCDYSQYALRMRPERIVVGEIRSSESTPLILNANNGHKGLLSSIHSNSAQSAPKRLSTLLCLYSGLQGITDHLAMDLICSGIDYILYLENKKVTQLIKLLNYESGVIHYDDILKSDDESFLSNFPSVA